MLSDSKNFFNLLDADNYACQIWSYNVSLGILSIKIGHRLNQSNVSWLTFLGVDYIDAPVMWQGANFQTGTPDELLGLCRRIGKSKNVSDEHLLKHNQLFKVRFEIDDAGHNYTNWLKILAIKATIAPNE